MISFGDQYAARFGLTHEQGRALDNGEIAQGAFEGIVAGGIARGARLGRPTTGMSRQGGLVDDVRPGSVGAQRVWTISARLKAAGLSSSGGIRFVPPKGYKPETPLARGPNNGCRDRFDNEWVKEPSRTKGEAFEWDVQLSRTGQNMLEWSSRDGRHLNVSQMGRISHRQNTWIRQNKLHSSISMTSFS